MSGCLMAGALMLALAPDGGFTLDWEHSVEHVHWREEWRLTERGIAPIRAAVKGSGAGMEPGPGGRMIDGWWVWNLDVVPVKRLALAASGATGGGWRLCTPSGCRILGRDAGEPVVLQPCPGAAPDADPGTM